jgi:riboflavin biosynthesis pyrimidine reductase
MALKARLVQELYLTISPILLSGRDNPGLVTGEAFSLQEAPRTEVLSQHWIGHELYLHLKINNPM